MRNAIFTRKRSLFTGMFWCLVFSLAAQEKTVNVTSSGELETLLTEEEYRTVKKLIVTTSGNVQLTAEDFDFMDAMPALEELELSGDLNTQIVSGFQNNQTIKKISFPAMMRNLAANTFTGSVLEGRVEFPATLNGSGNLQNRFDNCQQITEFAFPDGNNTLKAIDGVVFSADETILVKYPIAKGGKSYTIPEGVIAMSLNALGYNALLEEVTFSSTITMVNNEGTAVTLNNAFRDCTSLKTFIVPEDNPRFFSMDGILGDKIQRSLLILPPANTSETLIFDGELVQAVTGTFFSEAYHVKHVVFTEGFETISGNVFKPVDYTKVVLEYVEFPSTLHTLHGEVFHGSAQIRQFIFKSDVPPGVNNSAVFRNANGDQVRMGVPAASVEAYRNSDLSREFTGDSNKFPAAQIVPYYEITVEGGRSVLSASVEGFAIPIVASELKGMDFVNWVSETPGVVIEDPANPVTSFIMPESDVVIKAVYEISAVTTIDVTEISNYTENSLINADKIRLTGRFTNDELTQLKTALGNNQVITFLEIEETDITDFSDTDYFEIINPNCLKYVPEGITCTLPNFISGTTAISRIELTDRKPFDCPEGITTGTEGVVYTRDCYIDGGWETIVLPFAIDNLTDFADFRIEAFAELKENENSIRFEDITEWKANIPYILSYIGEETGSALETQPRIFSAGHGVTVQTTDTNPPFIATYTGLTSGQGVYLLNESGTEFGPGGAGSSVPPFRAYLDLNQQNAPVRLSVEHGGGTTDIDQSAMENIVYSREGILYIEASQSQIIVIYSIDGCKVKEQQISEGLNLIRGLPQGIYLLNNSKVIIK